MSKQQIFRYLELVDRRLYILMHSGISWKPEYGVELKNIDNELMELRKAVDAAHKKEDAIYGEKDKQCNYACS